MHDFFNLFCINKKSIIFVKEITTKKSHIMKTLITSVALQVNEKFNSFVVFTTQKNNGHFYDGFTPYTSIIEATKKAEEMTNIWNSECMSTALGYELITFTINGTKDVQFIKTK